MLGVFALLLLAGDEPLFAVPAVTHSWGSGGTEVRHGYVNAAGKIIIAPGYDQAGAFSGGFAVVGNQTWYFGDPGPGELAQEPEVLLIDRTGKKVMQHRLIYPPSEGRVVFCDAKCGWVELASGEDGGVTYDGLLPFSEGLAPVSVSGKWGYIDTGGKVVIAPKWIAAEPFHGGAARVAASPEAYGAVDKKGELVVPAKYRELALGADVWIVARANDLSYRYLDKKGQAVALTQSFAYAGLFEGGYAAAAVIAADGNWDYGYIGRDGKWLVRRHSQGTFFPVETMTGFHGGVAVLAEDRRDGWRYVYIDTAGKPLFGREFFEAGAFRDGRALVSFAKGKVQRYALVDTKGATVWEGPLKRE